MNRLCLLIILILTAVTTVYCQGLQFAGNERTIADRSSLHIPAKKGNGVGELRVTFDFRDHNLDSPGNILYWKNSAGNDSYTFGVNRNASGDSVNFSFAKSGEEGLCTFAFDPKDVSEKYLPVSITLDYHNGLATVRVMNKEKKVRLSEAREKKFLPELYFGMARHIVETASFSLRGLAITTDGTTDEIPLNENNGEIIHNRKGDVTGTVTNPTWLINYFYRWQPVWKTHSPSPTGFVFDHEGQTFFSYNTDSIKAFDLPSKSVSTVLVEGDSLRIRLGMGAFNSLSDKIVAYEVDSDVGYGELDPSTGRWEEKGTATPYAALHHHAAVYNEKDSSLLIFGGYGNRSYSNQLIKYDLARNQWDTIRLRGDRIEPRFFASMMATPTCDSLYLYGGKGNSSGNQDYGIKYYYDLFLIDLTDNRVTKLWEQTPPAKDHVPARTLIPDEDWKNFYAVTYPEYQPQTYLQLYRINMADGTATAVGDSIQMTSEEIATNVQLFYNPEFERLYCVTQEYEKYGQTTTTVYSLSTPPVTEGQLYKTGEEEGDKWRRHSAIAIIALLIIATGSGLALRSYRRRSVRSRKEPVSIHSDKQPAPDNTALAATESPYRSEKNQPDELKKNGSVISEATAANPEDTTSSDEVLVEIGESGVGETLTDENGTGEPNSYTNLETRQQYCNRISLFGPFTATDHKGRNITHLFSPKIRLLFLYIVINSIAGDGVTTSQLSATLWGDKEPDKIKNLRNVNINKLRKILADVEGIELIYEKGIFRLEIGEECYCDLTEVMALSSNLQDIRLKDTDAQKLDSILLRGKILADAPDPVFDSFRRKMEDYLTEYLTLMTHHYFKSGRYPQAMRLCNSLWNIDPLSEVALRYRVKILSLTGQTDKARSIFNGFQKEHRKMLGEDYPQKFEEI